MNGVTMPGVSAGSNQVGASEMCERIGELAVRRRPISAGRQDTERGEAEQLATRRARMLGKLAW